MENESPVPQQLPPYSEAIVARFEDKGRIREALAAMRPPTAVMSTEALKFVKASPLSFTRWLIKRMEENTWEIERVLCDISPDGSGMVIYRVRAEGRTMTFVVRCAGLAKEQRSGRIKDNDLDFHSVLFDSEVAQDRIATEMEEQVQKVWKGRTDNEALGWTFANRSNASFEYVVNALARGEQPDVQVLAENGGYLLRNAGFYGNGRHGCRSWQAFASNHPLSEPYHVDLFCLYLWRQVSFDLVEALARHRNADAVALNPEIKRYLGVGNSSGIGMVAALIRWPHWLSGYCFMREFALAVAITAPPSSMRLNMLEARLSRAISYYRETRAAVEKHLEDRLTIAEEIEASYLLLREYRVLGTIAGVSTTRPLKALLELVHSRFGGATYEQLVALIIETEPDLVSNLLPVLKVAMGARRDTVPHMSLRELRSLIERDYDWALNIDFSAPGARRYFWYRSEENGENRRGERGVDPGLEYETFIDVAGEVQGLYARLRQFDEEWTVARYLVECPVDVYIVSRVQFLRDKPYGEIRSNLLQENFRPSDLIQFYLAVLGMETTNPGNFRWVRGVFLQGAPLPEDIANRTHGDWTLPSAPQLSHKFSGAVQ